MTKNTRGYSHRNGCYSSRPSNGCFDTRMNSNSFCNTAKAPKIAGTKTGSSICALCTPEACQLQKELMSQYFIIVELELYLDGHPDNTDALKRYRCAVEEFESTLTHYEKVFGPLYARNNNCENEWQWVKTPWPWEV